MKTGDLLFCRDGSTVIVRYFDETHLIVEYKGKTYYRPASAIGDTLFISANTAIECTGKDTDTPKNSKTQECVEVYQTCSNCRKLSTEDCAHGGLQLCDNWAPRFHIEGQEDWPTQMLGPYGRYW